jgi:hypothetical protein
MWRLASDRNYCHKHLKKLHGPRCWTCGKRRRLELEHTRPLWSLTDQERTQLRWWLPFNLTLMCEDCHRDKTRAETSLRAAIRRGEADPFPTWFPSSEKNLPLYEQMGLSIPTEEEAT